jgi:hypothetical protein
MKPYAYDLRQRIFGYSLTHSIRETARHYHVYPFTKLRSLLLQLV